MASCSLRTADFNVSRLDVSRGRVSTLSPCSLRNWIGRTPQRFSSLTISHSNRKALHACCNASLETRIIRPITKSETGSEETKPSSLESQLIPKLHEVETLLTNMCDTSSIAEFELKLSGFNLRMVRGLKSKNLPLPPAPAPVIRKTSSIQSDLNGSVKTTSLALFKPEPVSSTSPEGISRFVEKATDEGLAILPSPIVGFFRRSRTIKGKRAPPSCKENQEVKEGQVLCYIDQLGAEIPIESDISGEVVKILRKDGEAVGYGDALIALLPSFPGIKKLQ